MQTQDAGKDTGRLTEQITDDLGKMQYIPFPTCNETSQPLALRYGVTETVNCTVDALPDEPYHLLEYYVHSDVPMTCRVPTVPLASGKSHYKDEDDDDDDDDKKHGEALDTDPAYTPLTFALQGTLQRSHLHMWTDMNVLVHNIASGSSTKKSKKSKNKNKDNVSPGYVVAGTAYSLPEFDNAALQKSTSSSSSTREKKEKAVVAMSDAAREPWTAGHGTKVIRGEPLTFTFYVSWVEGGRGVGWPSGPSSLSPSSQAFTDASSSSSGAGSFFSRLFFFLLAASVGGLAALHWERKRRSGWRGDGILGVPPAAPRGKGPTGVVGFGNGGRINGYGGFSASASPTPGGNGLTGKRD